MTPLMYMFFLLCVFTCAFIAISGYMALQLSRLLEDYRKQIKAYTDALESIKERMKVIEAREKQR